MSDRPVFGLAAVGCSPGLGAWGLCGGHAACAAAPHPGSPAVQRAWPGPAEVSVWVSPAAGQGLGGESSIHRLFKALNACTHRAGGWAGPTALGGGRAAAFWRLGAFLSFHCSAPESRHWGGSSPAWLTCQRDRLGLAGSLGNPCAPKAAAAQRSFVPRTLSRRAGLQGPEQEQHCWQPGLCGHAHAAQGARGAHSCRSPSSLGLAVFQGRVPEAAGAWPRGCLCVLRGEGTGYCCCVPLQRAPLGGRAAGGGAQGWVPGAGWVAGGSQARGGCAHGWGMWVYPGRRAGPCPCSRGPVPACRWLPVGAAPAAASPVAAFPGEQLRLSVCVGALTPHLAALLGQVGALFGFICWRAF